MSSKVVFDVVFGRNGRISQRKNNENKSTNQTKPKSYIKRTDEKGIEPMKKGKEKMKKTNRSRFISVPKQIINHFYSIHS